MALKPDEAGVFHDHDVFNASDEDLDALLDSAEKEEGASTASTTDDTKGASSGADDAGQDGKDTKATDSSTATDAGKQDDKGTETATTDDGKPAGVLAKDGQHVIPHYVLENTRKSERQYRELAEQQQAELDRLKAELASAREKAGETGDVDTTDMDAEELQEAIAKMKSDFPEFGKFAEVLTKKVSTLVEVTKGVRERAEADAAQERDTVADRVQAAIDANPTLLHWQHHDEAAFEAAVATDKFLRGLPAWKDKSYEERFSEVVDRVKRDYPGVSLPTPTQQTQGQDGKGNKPGAKGASDKDIQAALAKATPGGPESLGDLPGGVDPSTDDFSNASAVQLEEQFQKMTPEQIEARIFRSAG